MVRNPSDSERLEDRGQAGGAEAGGRAGRSPAAGGRAGRSPAADADPPRKGANDTVKETFESLVIAFVLAFVFRAYVVEAFVIPTGSMAPTLLGQHLDVTCVQCGYRFPTEPPGGADQLAQGVFKSELRGGVTVQCPMCQFPNRLEGRTATSPGDRILVHKYIYSFSEPRRWDVVVFKNPQRENQQDHSPGPTTNYIKRLVGLPQEDLWIVEGNVYVRPAGAGDEQWRIARKTDTSDGAHRAEMVQRAAWQPVYHSDYVPVDWKEVAARAEDRPAGFGERRWSWRTPWQAVRDGRPTDQDSEAHWRIAGATGYRYDGKQAGRIRLDFSRAVTNRHNYYPYNQLSDSKVLDDPVEDVRVAAGFQPEAPGLSVCLKTSARWENSPEAPVPLAGRIDAQGVATLEAQVDGQYKPLDSVSVGVFAPGRTRQVELWYVDQELSLWVDGRCVLRRGFELKMETVLKRKGLEPLRFPQVEIEVAGAPVSLHRVEVDRDLYYTSRTAQGGQQGWGTYLKTSLGGRGELIGLESDEFFCLGDNSPRSLDGRFWTDVDPWIRESMLGDKTQQLGVVPRRLMMGRAFFVYFPAPHRLTPTSIGVFPNFGDMRFIH